MVLGTANDDNLKGTNGDDLIEGLAGDDKIKGRNGNDTLDGGEGDDKIKGSNGDDVIFGGLGNDDIDGGSDNDTIDAGEGDDEVDGGSGNDSIDAGDGNNEVDGGSGDDEILAGAGEDSIDGGSGDDTIDSGAGDDAVDGNSGDDTIEMGAGNDTAEGGSGDDTFTAGQGDDFIDGGTGNEDTVIFAGECAEYIATLVDGQLVIEDTVPDRDGIDTIEDVEIFVFANGTLSLEEVLENCNGEGGGPQLEEENIFSQARISQVVVDESFIDSTDGYDLEQVDDFGETTTVTGQEMAIGGVGWDAEVYYTYVDFNHFVAESKIWNKPKNIEVEASEAATVELTNFVHTDVTLGDGGDSVVNILDAKRGFITTGNGNDSIDIVSLANNASFSHKFVVDTNGGDDEIILEGVSTEPEGISRFDVDAGDGNDVIYIIDNGRSDSTINGGAGNDTIDVDSDGVGIDIIEVTGADFGDDIVTDFSATEDWVDMSAYSNVSIANNIDGDAVITTTDATGSITLVGVDASELTLGDNVIV